MEINSDWQGYLVEIEERLDHFFLLLSEIIMSFNNQIQTLEQIDKVDERVLFLLRDVFRTRNDIMDFITMTRANFDRFKPIKEMLDIIFGKAEFIVKDLEQKEAAGLDAHRKIEHDIQ